MLYFVISKNYKSRLCHRWTVTNNAPKILILSFREIFHFYKGPNTIYFILKIYSIIENIILYIHFFVFEIFKP
jgi:hypothetical protein